MQQITIFWSIKKFIIVKGFCFCLLSQNKSFVLNLQNYKLEDILFTFAIFYQLSGKFIISSSQNIFFFIFSLNAFQGNVISVKPEKK